MEWYTATRIARELGMNWYAAKQVVNIINAERLKKNLYIPNINTVPAEALEKKLGVKIKNALSVEW